MMIGFFHPVTYIVVFTIFCHVVYDYYNVRIFVIWVITFIVKRWYCSISLLTSTVPKLESNVETIDDSILKGKIVTNGCDCVLFIIFPFESWNERRLSYNTLSYEANFDKFINIFNLFLFRKHVHERVVDCGFTFIEYGLAGMT